MADILHVSDEDITTTWTDRPDVRASTADPDGADITDTAPDGDADGTDGVDGADGADADGTDGTDADSTDS